MVVLADFHLNDRLMEILADVVSVIRPADQSGSFELDDAGESLAMFHFCTGGGAHSGFNSSAFRGWDSTNWNGNESSGSSGAEERRAEREIRVNTPSDSCVGPWLLLVSVFPAS